MAAGMFLFTVKLLVLLIVIARFTAVFTGRYAAQQPLNTADECECCRCFSNELLSNNCSRLSYTELTYISTSPVISAYLYRPSTVLLWSRSSGFPPYRPQATIKSSFIAALLLLAGDVENNPGPARATADQLIVKVNIGILNCRSAVHKAALLHDQIVDRQLDVLFLTETWFTNDTPAAVTEDIAPPQYAVLNVPRQLCSGGPSRGGGLAVVLRQNLVVRQHPLSDSLRPRTFEAQLVRVGLPPSSHTVLHIYRPQWMSTVPEFVDELSDVIASLNASCTDNLVVCGDVNCPGPAPSSVDVGLADVLDSLGLTQLVSSPTRDNNLLDILASTSSTLVTNIAVDDAGLISDHRIVTANITVRSPKPTVAYSWRQLRKVDPSTFERAIRQSELFTNPAVATDDYAQQLVRVVSQQLDVMAPLRHGLRRPPKPITKWLSPEAVAAKRLRRRLERKWRSTGLDQDRRAYRHACRTANKLIQASRRDFFQAKLSTCSQQSPAKRWRTVNELLHTDVTDRTRTDDENSSLCRSFADFFVSKIDHLKLSITAKLSSISNPPVFSEPQHIGPLFSHIPPVSAAEVLKVLISSPVKASSADCIPPSIIKACPDLFSELIAELANRSFLEGVFPSCFKHASVVPLLKKPSLDKHAPSSYRPISNLDYISKILERLFLSRIQPHITSSPNFNQYQSAYRRHHSTETSVLHTLDNILLSSDSGKSTVVISLDLSAAFDTIDYDILLSRLSTSFGISETTLSWLKSYLSNRTFSVRIGRHCSSSVTCTTGVPQGSVLGPLLFTAYISPIAGIADLYRINQQQYADDTQLFISLSPSNYLSDLDNLTNCLDSLHVWFCANGMALNPDKSEAILVGTRQRSSSYSNLTTVNVAGSQIPLADHIKILGVTLDKNLSMDNHVNAVSKSIHYHIRALRHIRSSISEDMAKMVACALVGSRLDYANSVLYGTTQKNISKLQKAQNLLARVVTCSPRSFQSSSHNLLQQLHWLPIKHRINFKIANITFRTLHSSQPVYLRSVLHSHLSTRSLRLSHTNLLSAPFVRTSFGARSFSVAAPKIWNSLPPALRMCTSHDTFRHQLKTHYFQQAFQPT